VYANTDKTGVQTGQFLQVKVGSAQFIYVPASVGEARTNSDTLVLTPGLRYGFSANTEIYGRASWLARSARIQDGDGLRGESENRFADAWVGINRRLVPEGKTPALLGFAEMALAEKSGGETAYGKSWLIGATAYRTLDPVVLAATVAYRLNQPRQVDGDEQKPGNFLLVNPTINFAVNDRVTLSTGMQWRRQEADRNSGAAQGIATTRTDMYLGLGFQWDEHITLNFGTRANISGGDGAEVGLTALVKLGE